MTEREHQDAKRYIYKRLALKPMTTKDLCKELAAKQISKHVIEEVIKEITALGYLNDQEWMESFIRSQAAQRKGPQAIAAKLRAKGFNEEQYDSLIQTLAGDEQQLSSIQKLLATRYRNRDLHDFRERGKVIASLVRRGYELDLILEALKKGKSFIGTTLPTV